MGGRGGSSGLSSKAGILKIPELQGSEKQVAWAKDIRAGYTFSHEEIKRALESNKASGHDAAIRGAIESIVFKKHQEKFGGYMAAMRDQFRREPYTRKYALEHNIRITGIFAKEMEAERRRAKKKYHQWLIEEYKKILKEKSAKRWIEHR